MYRCLDFSGAITWRVDIGAGTSLDNLQPYSILALAKAENVTTQGKIYQKGAGTAAQLLEIEASAIRIISGRVTSNLQLLAPTANFPNFTRNKWCWFAGTADNTSLTNSGLWVASQNGRFTPPTSYTAQTVGSGAQGNNSTVVANIGNRTGSNIDWQGQIAFVAIYGAVLGPEEFDVIRRAVFNGQLHSPKSLPQAKLYMHLGLNGNGQQFDYSGNGNHGTVTSCTYEPVFYSIPELRRAYTQTAAAAGGGPLIRGGALIKGALIRGGRLVA